MHRCITAPCQHLIEMRPTHPKGWYSTNSALHIVALPQRATKLFRAQGLHITNGINDSFATEKGVDERGGVGHRDSTREEYAR